ncbi:MAG: bifunctional diguanylate cyclase/phosphodiesterase, partial [Pseudomonadota bacterium]
VNTNFSYADGDLMLRKVVTRFQKLVPESNYLARLGSDQFAILIENFQDETFVEKFIHKLLCCSHEPYEINKFNIYMTFSIGIAVFPTAATTIDTLMQAAHTALKQAKSHGRNQYVFYKGKLTLSHIPYLHVENKLKSEILAHAFFLNYQPIYDINSNKILGIEVLLRGKEKSFGIISTETIISLAEEIGEILPITDWIFNEAFKQFANWKKIHNIKAKMYLNLSVYQLDQAAFYDHIKTYFKKYQCSPNDVAFEITETSIIPDLKHAVMMLKKLRQLGCHIFLDDFGSGYSSMNLLRLLPIDGFKIDRSFVQKIEHDIVSANIVKSLLELGNNLHLKVIPEGVENRIQLDFIRHNGGKYVQGFLLGCPEDAKDILPKLLS